MTILQQSSGLTCYRQENGIFVFRLLNNRRATFDTMIDQAYPYEALALDWLEQKQQGFEAGKHLL